MKGTLVPLGALAATVALCCSLALSADDRLSKSDPPRVCAAAEDSALYDCDTGRRLEYQPFPGSQPGGKWVRR